MTVEQKLNVCRDYRYAKNAMHSALQDAFRGHCKERSLRTAEANKMFILGMEDFAESIGYRFEEKPSGEAFYTYPANGEMSHPMVSDVKLVKN